MKLLYFVCHTKPPEKLRLICNQSGLYSKALEERNFFLGYIGTSTSNLKFVRKSLEKKKEKTLYIRTNFKIFFKSSIDIIKLNDYQNIMTILDRSAMAYCV